MTMLRQASSRNQRAKGFKLKHALQICVLVAICIWLLYQVKHSHDKKKALEERNSNAINKVDQSHPEIFRINRKDLPQMVETDTVNEIHNEEEQNEEFEEAEQETKQEETEDEEGRGDGDEEIDEQDQERDDEEADRGEFGNDEDKDGRAEELDLVEKEDQDVGSQEAREESFKGDDASSAVFEGTQNANLESDGDSRDLDEEKVENMMEGKEVQTEGGQRSLDEEKVENVERKEEETETTENMMNETADSPKDNDSSVQDVVDGSKGADSVVAFGEKEPISSGNLMVNGTGAETRKLEDVSISNSTLAESEDQSVQQINSTTTISNDQTEQQTDSTTTVVPEDQMEKQNSTMVIDMVTDVGHLQNESLKLDSVPDRDDTVEMETQGGDASNSDNVSVDQGQHSDTTSTTTQEESNESITTSSAENENVNVAQAEAGDTSHNLLTEEEKEAHTDLSILPGEQTDAKSVEEVAAE